MRIQPDQDSNTDPDRKHWFKAKNIGLLWLLVLTKYLLLPKLYRNSFLFGCPFECMYRTVGPHLKDLILLQETFLDMNAPELITFFSSVWPSMQT
jgi:hypothetical protein